VLFSWQEVTVFCTTPKMAGPSVSRSRTEFQVTSWSASPEDAAVIQHSYNGALRARTLRSPDPNGKATAGRPALRVA
jgi:hypothetical protein